MEFLKYFITEEIYVLPGEKETTGVQKDQAPGDENDSVHTEKPGPDIKAASATDDNIGDTQESAVDITEETEKTPAKQDTYPVAVISGSLNEKEEKLLEAILGAIKIDPATAQRIESLAQVSSNSVIAFGAYDKLDKFPKYQVIKKGGKQLLVSDTLSEVSADVEKKKELWEALKQMFIA